MADATNPAVQQQIAAVYKVLEELGIEAKDTLLVLNKIDAVADCGQLDWLSRQYPNALQVMRTPPAKGSTSWPMR